MWRLRCNLFSHIIVQEVGFFDRVRTGELMNRLSEVRRLPHPERCHPARARMAASGSPCEAGPGA